MRKVTSHAIIEAVGLTKNYDDIQAVRGIDFAIQPGEIFGFLGPNGAGKTSTIRMIMGFTKPTAGAVTVFGQPAFNPPATQRTNLGYVPTGSCLYPRWTVGVHIKFVEKLYEIHGKNRGQQLATELGLVTNMRVSQLSTGNRQKLAIILGLISKPKLLVMDEPTQGLDPVVQNEIHHILSRFRDEGGTIFISSHDLREVEKLCDRVGIIREGELVETASIRDLRERTVHQCYATFHKPIRLTDFDLPGVSVVSHGENSVNLKIKGQIQPVVELLAKLKVADLEFSHADLESILLEYYE